MTQSLGIDKANLSHISKARQTLGLGSSQITGSGGVVYHRMLHLTEPPKTTLLLSTAKRRTRNPYLFIFVDLFIPINYQFILKYHILLYIIFSSISPPYTSSRSHYSEPKGSLFNILSTPPQLELSQTLYDLVIHCLIYLLRYLVNSP